MIYSGYPKREDAPDDLVYVSKPASHEKIVAAMEGLIQRAEDALPKAADEGVHQWTTSR